MRGALRMLAPVLIQGGSNAVYQARLPYDIELR
jgi:hypothetical protein